MVNNPKKGRGLSREDLNEFFDQVADAISSGERDHSGVPFIEVSKDVIEHYNRNAMEGFHKAGYFIFQGVKVYLTGSRDSIAAKDQETMEQRVFGNV